VTNHGAACDGVTDDTAAIQAAINANAGGTVTLCTGTSIIAPPSKTEILDLGAGNIRITGCGTGCSTLKIKDSAGDFNAIFGPSGGTPSNVQFDNFTMDYNSTNNQPVSLSTYSRDFTYYGNGCTVTNYDHLQVLDINSVNVAYTGCDHSNVTASSFTMNTTGTYYHDSSVLYIAGDNSLISGNTFQGGVNAAGSTTAIETHASHTSVTGNNIDA